MTPFSLELSCTKWNMNIQEKIKHKQWKDARYRKAERVLRRIRQRIFDYEDAGKLEKAHKVMGYLQVILAPYWEACRKAAEDRKLQQTPSAFEPGLKG